MTTATAAEFAPHLPESVEELRAVVADARKGYTAEYRGSRREETLAVYSSLRQAAEEKLAEILNPETLTVHVDSKSYEVEVSNGSRGNSVDTKAEFAVLAGRTATKTRLGSIGFSKLYGPKVRFAGQPGERIEDQIWAEDADGNRYGFNGVFASGNKGQYGPRVVGHISDTEITAKV